MNRYAMFSLLLIFFRERFQRHDGEMKKKKKRTTTIHKSRKISSMSGPSITFFGLGMFSAIHLKQELTVDQQFLLLATVSPKRWQMWKLVLIRPDIFRDCRPLTLV